MAMQMTPATSCTQGASGDAEVARQRARHTPEGSPARKRNDLVG